MSLPALLVATLLAGPDTADSRACEPPPPGEAGAAVRALNQQYIDAARTNDAAWFRTHMADDVVVVLGSGRRLRKPEFLALVQGGPTTLKSLALRDVTVRVFGPTVQVDADAPWERNDGQTGVSRYIDTYAWLDCRWQVISAQITLLPRPDRP